MKMNNLKRALGVVAKMLFYAFNLLVLLFLCVLVFVCWQVMTETTDPTNRVVWPIFYAAGLLAYVFAWSLIDIFLNVATGGFLSLWNRNNAAQVANPSEHARQLGRH